MARAFELGLIGAAVAFAAPALAGGAPVAYYPSLGYGQMSPAYAPPAARDPAPPRREPAEAPPPGDFEHRTYDREAYGSEQLQRYESRSEVDSGYDTGWSAEDGQRAYASSSREDHDYDSGWRVTRRELAPHPREAAGYGHDEHVPDSFFADGGGVGPEGFAWGGGGAYAVGGGSASAYASAYASASAHVGVRLGRHGGGRHGGGHGCGCKR